MGFTRYMTTPTFKLTLNSSHEYTRNNAFLTRITRRENGLDLATIDFVDTRARHWINDFDAGDAVLMQVKDAAADSWTTLFRGRIAPAAEPYMPDDMLHLKCEGNGWPLAYMMVAAEYGSQVDAALDEPDEIADDIIDNYVEKIFADAASGFTVDTEIDAATLTSTMRYMSFPYVPAYKCVDQMLETYQGVRGTNAGAHWLVDNSATPKLYIQPIGSHSVQAVADGWTNYLGGSDATYATFTQGESNDFTGYRFSKPVKEANYVLYYGAWKHPCPIDLFTENNSADWDGEELQSGNPVVIADEATTVAYGSKSIKVTSENGISNGAAYGVWFWYPDTYDLNLDLTKVGGNYNKAALNFLVWPSSTFSLKASDYALPQILLGTGDPADFDCFHSEFVPPLEPDTWNRVSVPVGDNSGWIEYNSPDWTDIDWIGFRFWNVSGTPYLFIDGLHFSGYVMRVVAQAGGYSANDPCIMKTVTDDYAKDDVIADEDKTGTISKLAYAEYLRSSSTPVTGTFTTKLVKDLWPGQKLVVQAKRAKTGAFRVNTTFRVPQFTHVIGGTGFWTEWQVTSDVTNTHTQPAYNSVNRNLAAVRPGTQDMQATSMKMREIDITQPRLVNTY